MFKKQALTLIISALAFTSTAQALGLGDIELESHLNEPLDAEIELLQLRGLTAGEILPTLASNDAFVRAGVERNFFLSNIQFQVQENEAGELIIALSTRQPVREPFLNFLVEVNWPGGRLLKEYTLLLDPPVFDTGVVGESLVVEPAAQPTRPTEITTTTTVSQPETTTETVPANVQPREENLGPNEYRVKRNDTLWEIAAGLPAGNGYSPQQIMLAIQDLNPNAFLNNNINRLKAGSLLTLPNESQIATRTVQEAIAEVRRQNDGGTARPRASADTEAAEVQLSATESTSSALPQGEGERNPDGYLEVAADTETEGTSAGGEAGTNAEIERLENELAIAGELNDQFRREKEELESRVAQMEEQIAIMQRLLNVQSGDAAALQSELAAREAEAAAEGETGDGEMMGETAQTPADSGRPGQQSNQSGQAEAGTTQPTQPEPAQPVQTQPEPQPTQPAQPQIQPQPEPMPEPGFMGFIKQTTAPVTNWLTSSLYNMVIAAAGLIVLLMIPLYLRSRSNKSEESYDEAPVMADGGLAEPQFEEDLDDDLLGDFEEDTPLEVEDEGGDETSDAIMEAEMYMAYQKYEQAEEKLKTAYAEEPGRTDIGLKLLEVYAETGNAAAFDDLEQRLSLTADQQAQADDFRSRMPMTGDASADDDLSMDLDSNDDLDFGLDTDTEQEEDIPSLEDLEQDLKSSSGTYDLSDFGSDTAEAEEETGPVEVKSSENDDLDFSLDLDDLDIDNEPEKESEQGLDLDLGDLGLEEVEPEAPKNLSVESDDSSALDFSLDEDEGDLDSDLDFSLDETEKPVEPELPTMVTEEDDLDLDFSSFDDNELEPATTDELPTDDALSLDENAEEDDLTDGEEIAFDFTDESSEPEAEMDLEPEVEPEPVAAEPEEANLQELADALPGGAELDDDEFDFLSGSDEASTKLDLARAYIEMDDKEGARDILEEVAIEGNTEQQQQAKELMDQL